MSQHSPHRPSDREICSKVNEALEAVENDNIAIIDERHNQEAMELCQATCMDDVFDYIKVFLEEIRQIGPVDCFFSAKNSGITDRCYHPGYGDVLLFPYAWDSSYMGQRIYLKFGIRKKSKNRPHQILTYYHLDCHEDRP